MLNSQNVDFETGIEVWIEISKKRNLFPNSFRLKHMCWPKSMIGWQETTWHFYEFCLCWMTEMKEILLQIMSKGNWSLWGTKAIAPLSTLRQSEQKTWAHFRPLGKIALLYHHGNKANVLNVFKTDSIKHLTSSNLWIFDICICMFDLWIEKGDSSKTKSVPSLPIHHCCFLQLTQSLVFLKLGPFPWY